MQDVSFQIAVLLINIHLPQALSLKDKRMVLKSIKDRARAKFNVTLAELDGQEKWQVATLGFAFIGNERRHLDSCAQNLLTFVESYPEIQICDSSLDFC